MSASPSEVGPDDFTADPRIRRSRGLIGSTTPRLWTKPKRRLTEKTSKGFACIRFAEGLGIELYPWQKWALIHALELLPDGSYRFRVVVICVARQNGKTTLLKVLSLWRMLEDQARLVVGTSTNMEYAREAWGATVDLAEERDKRRGRELAAAATDDGTAAGLDDAEVLAFLPRAERWVKPKGVKRGALDTSMTLLNGARYKLASTSRTGGRSLSIDLAIADELREHRAKGVDDTGWEAWSALDGATTARPNSQIWGLSNAGDNGSVVLNHFRGAAIDAIENGGGDDTLCLLEWSADDNCDVTDRRQWAKANPALGYGAITEAMIESKSKLPPQVFRPEHLCQGVPTLRVAIPEAAWRGGVDPGVTLDKVRRRVAVVVDVSPDLLHVSLVAAGVGDDDRVRLEVIAAWKSPEEMRTHTAERPSLEKWLTKIRPKVVGWMPDGPAAAIAADMSKVAKRHKVHELVGREVGQACQGLAEQAVAGRLLHRDDPMLTGHVLGANKLNTGDGWRFVRRGAGHVDGAYAAAGAVHLARMMPRPKVRKMVTSAA